MSDSAESRGKIPLPLALVVLAVFFGAMKFPDFRPIGARSGAFLLPIGVAWAGAGKLRDAHPLLRRAGLVLAMLVALWAELPALRVFFGVGELALDPFVMRVGAAVLALGSLTLEAIAARRSLRARLTAWLGIALGFSAYLAGVAPAEPDSELGLVFVAGIIGLWGGGFAGLMLGALGAKLAAAPAAVTPKAP
jgi:hypothetical protein